MCSTDQPHFAILRLEDAFFPRERHLVDDGCFIFDINTQRKLDRHIGEPAWVHSFGNNLLIMKVTAAPKRASNWNIKVFEHVNGNRYLLHEESIGEASFTTRKIIDALNVHFRHVNVIDPDRNVLHYNRRGCTLSAGDDRAVSVRSQVLRAQG